ncbi:MAG: thermonuclease family protein [Rhodospirillaceae bacterium]
MIRTRAIIVAGVAFSVLVLCIAPAPTADAPVEALVEAQVTAVVDGDTVALDRSINGATQVRLTGIQTPKLPLGRLGFKEWPLAPEAKRAMEDLVLGKSVRLTFPGNHMDRHGRLLAHLYKGADASCGYRGT